VTEPEDLPGFGTLQMRDLAILSYAQGFTLWHYKALHLPTWRLMIPGFFDPAGEKDRMKLGDMILLSAADGGSLAYVGPGTQGARITLRPVNNLPTMENACPNTQVSPRPPARSRLGRILRRLVNPGFWSR
jgi:hypothetical protein